MIKKTTAAKLWTTEAARTLYGIDAWGASFFSISDEGNVEVHLKRDAQSASVPLIELCHGMTERGIELPVMLRFGQLLAARISLLNDTFRSTMNELGYRGGYRGVFPIKVNQQHQVVEEVVRFGRPYHHGLEVGSKAELLAALAYMNDPEAFIICNGYKDEEFIDLALFATKMNRRVLLVVEMLPEIRLISTRSKHLGIRPQIGLRAKLSTPGSGQWVGSGGDQSVFGLTTTHLMHAVDQLRSEGLLDCIRMLHYHLGSQIPNINTVREAANEAARMYVGLVQEGATMGVLDTGGGLALDYDGSHSDSKSSCNYDLHEYCAGVVEVIRTVCDEAEIDHPLLISESGRAVVAPYGVLLFNVLDVDRTAKDASPQAPPGEIHEYSRYLHELATMPPTSGRQETLNDARFYRDQVRAMFNYGKIGLRERAFAEHSFKSIIADILEQARNEGDLSEELSELQTVHADIYYGNFSIFQSMPDAWSLNQFFPTMPIHRLKDAPTRTGLFADITCDSDGKIDHFITSEGTSCVLPLHPLNPGEEYVIGVFMVGAYQETLGDLHNLFGDTNVVSIELAESGKLVWSHLVKGDTAADVLGYVEYEPKQLVRQFRLMAESAVSDGFLTASECRQVVDAYERGMGGYTYFAS